MLNEVVFPAGILQPPFFDIEADDTVCYGAIGSVIGDEISHGFDDQGAEYDAREQELVNRLATDPHAPDEFRCNRAVQNMFAFRDTSAPAPATACGCPRKSACTSGAPSPSRPARSHLSATGARSVADRCDLAGPEGPGRVET